MTDLLTEITSDRSWGMGRTRGSGSTIGMKAVSLKSCSHKSRSEIEEMPLNSLAEISDYDSSAFAKIDTIGTLESDGSLLLASIRKEIDWNRFKILCVRYLLWWNNRLIECDPYEEWSSLLVQFGFNPISKLLGGDTSGLWWYMWNFRNKLL
ncbi:hypothetical protein Tco_0807009 [Tanacetum coccineum]